MKNIIFVLLSALIIVSAYSCKNKEPSPDIVIIKPPIEPIPVDSSKLKPEIKFHYMLLDSGQVQFYNDTKNVIDNRWYVAWMRTKQVNPKVKFLVNGDYAIVLRIINNYGIENDTTFKININNVTEPNEMASVKGILFNNSYEYISSAVPRNAFYGYGEPSYPRGTPTSGWNLGNQGQTISIADFMENQGQDYETMKNNFKVGKQPLAELKSYPTGDYSLKKHGWYFLFVGKNGTYATGNSVNDSLEILEVKEVFQPKLFPEMEEKAFWVTWHIKADTGERGKIDCVLKMKYIIYKQYFDF